MSTSDSRRSTNGVPQPVAPIADLMSSFPAPWALCGGWAVDAWLGRSTREHVDVDISVFVQDRQALFEHLAGWQLVAHGLNVEINTHKLWDSQPLDFPGHIHARLDRGEVLPDGDLLPEQGFTLDIQLGDRSGTDWVLNAKPRIVIPIEDAVQKSPWGLPAVVPEVLLFFKSLELRRRDKLDFLALLPHLTQERRDWVRGAISLAGHPWLSQLSP
ncbi:MAG: hypothetical protein IH957_02690 [Chloroflexi bacterium]|nr:hypothetical protein [Chloroflexota bacterium]